MESAIFYAVLPGGGTNDARQTAAAFFAAIARIESNGSVKQLGFVWEVNFRESPDGLAVLVRACEQQLLPYGILPLADVPRWIRRDPNG